MKQQKKQLKKEQIEREEAIKEKLKEANKVITLLNTLTNEGVRNNFLNETNDITVIVIYFKIIQHYRSIFYFFKK